MGRHGRCSALRRLGGEVRHEGMTPKSRDRFSEKILLARKRQREQTMATNSEQVPARQAPLPVVGTAPVISSRSILL